MADLKPVDWLTLIALVLGPVSAVLITLWIEERRKVRDARTYILRMLMTTRMRPGDRNYIYTVNVVPVEFHDEPEGIKAWRDYGTVVAQRAAPGEEAAHVQQLTVKQAALIFSIMEVLGFKQSEGEIQTSAYISQAYVDREMLYVDSLRAMRELANAMTAQVRNTDELLRLVRAPRTPPIG
jgi:hypothetical protein